MVWLQRLAAFVTFIHLQWLYRAPYLLKSMHVKNLQTFSCTSLFVVNGVFYYGHIARGWQINRPVVSYIQIV